MLAGSSVGRSVDWSVGLSLFSAEAGKIFSMGLGENLFLFLPYFCTQMFNMVTLPIRWLNRYR